MLITEIDESTGIARDMSAEEWAALWGSTDADGVYFYNFASVEHTTEFLIEFLRVINCQIVKIEESLKKTKKDYGWTQKDLDNMGLLYEYVEELLEEAQNKI